MATDHRLRRYAHVLRPPPVYPVWCVTTVTVLALVVLGTVAAIIFFVGHADVLKKSEWTLLVCACFLFVFMTAGLYSGARVKRRDLPASTWSGAGEASNYATEGVGVTDFVDVGSDSVVGCLLSIIISIVLACFAGLVVWLIIQSGGAAIVGVFFAVCWVMYRALRAVFSHSRKCRGRLVPSMGYAAMYTMLYLGWLFVVLYLVGRARS